MCADAERAYSPKVLCVELETELELERGRSADAMDEVATLRERLRTLEVGLRCRQLCGTGVQEICRM